MVIYEEVIARLFEAKSSRRMKLEKMQMLGKALGHPEKTFPSIHVAGTNGKGSTTLKIAKALEFSGLKVGLYTSPHLSSYRERICINGEMISCEEVVELMKEIFFHVNDLQIPANFFEMTTLLCFAYFQKKKVDVAVIETGLGGRFDATNILRPILSVITSIGKDHVAILGSTLEEIAFEKAGIIKEDIPVVIGPKARFQSIFKRAEELSSQVIVAKEGHFFYDEENREIARAALIFLKDHFPLEEEDIQKGLKVRPACRFEEIGGAIVDVAHNVDGFTRLIEALKFHHPKRSFRMLLGMSKDKEIKDCLSIASKEASHLHLVEAYYPRAASTDELAQILKNLGAFSFTKESSIDSGVKNALQKARENEELLVIAGSFYIMADVREALGCETFRDNVKGL